MAKGKVTTCQCCLKALKNAESRIQTTDKTREIFNNFIGKTLFPGIICGRCNINLLTFDAFQKEIKRKHDELLESLRAKANESINQLLQLEQEEELIEGIIFEEADEEPETILNVVQQETITKPQPAPEPEQNQSTGSTNDDVDDENDCCFVPQEPQVPIDLDEISDEPEQPKEKEPEEIIFKCDHCSAVSSKKEVIIKHIKQTHTFKCEACRKIYPTTERLNSHIMRIHNPNGGNKRKQKLSPMDMDDDSLKFRMKSKPYGRPWPSTLAKRQEEFGY